MKLHASRVILLFVASALSGCAAREAQESPAVPVDNPLRAALIDTPQVSDLRLTELKESGIDTIVLPLPSATAVEDDALQSAVSRVREQGLNLYYWVEVARSSELADAHPAWMASLQGHDEWRRLFPDAPEPSEDQVVKVYPWVPLLYQEAYDAHLQRIADALRAAPAADGVFLNDLQGAPSACGCGNILCRWTADYGPIRTATEAPADAAARFVRDVEQLVPHGSVIPVWVTECEEHDGAADGACAGVGCFRGICWKAYTEQLAPVAEHSERLAVLATYIELQRDLPEYRRTAGWIGNAVRTFQTMPPAHKGSPIAAQRLITVLQGWNVSPSELQSQVDESTLAGTAGYVIAYWPIDQAWQPQLYRWK